MYRKYGQNFLDQNLSRNLLHPRPQFDLKLVNFTQNIDLYFRNFLAPTGALGVTILVRLSVCPCQS